MNSSKWRRWVRRQWPRTYEWQATAFYWAVTRQWRAKEFQTQKLQYSAIAWLRTRKESTLLLLQIFQTVFGQVLLATALVVGLEVLESFLLNRGGLVPGLSAAHERLGLQLRGSSYTSILVALAQISGIFLGLYFTAVSIVASTVYARVSTDVRALLVREKVGDLYIKLVALLGALAVLVLAKNSLGFAPNVLDLGLITILGVSAILSFVILGRRIFDFFDPTRLVTVGNQHKWDSLGPERSGVGKSLGELPEGPVMKSSPIDGGPSP